MRQIKAHALNSLVTVVELENNSYMYNHNVPLKMGNNFRIDLAP